MPEVVGGDVRVIPDLPFVTGHGVLEEVLAVLGGDQEIRMERSM